MKKQKLTIKNGLTLGKRTISNLSEAEMNLQGGQWTVGCSGRMCGGKSRGCTNKNSCEYTCV